jgi:ligand-binding SRPBCC domain-containing protein
METDSVCFSRSPVGRGFRMEAAQFVPHPREKLFKFFAEAHGLEAITPPWLKFTVITPDLITITAGAVIDYKLRLRGIPIRWRSLISEWEPPVRFVDEQLRGPYRRWHHEHVFEAVEGGTICRDNVDYEVPGGRLINWLLVERDLLKIFRFRQEKLRSVFP